MDPNCPFPPSPRDMYMYCPPQMNGHNTPTKERPLPTLPERNPETQLGKRMSSTRSSKSSRGSTSTDRYSPPPSPGPQHHPNQTVSSPCHHAASLPTLPHLPQQQHPSAKRTYQENKPFSYAAGILSPKNAPHHPLHESAILESSLRPRDASPHNGRQVKSEVSLTAAEDYARFMHYEEGVFQDTNSSSVYQRIHHGNKDPASSTPNGIVGTKSGHSESQGCSSPTNGSHSEGIYGKFVQPGHRPKLTYVPPPVVPTLTDNNLTTTEVPDYQQQLKSQQQCYSNQQHQSYNNQQQSNYSNQQQPYYSNQQQHCGSAFPHQSHGSMHSAALHGTSENPNGHYQLGVQAQPCCRHPSTPGNASPIMSPKVTHKKRSVNDPCPPIPGSAERSGVAPPQLPSRHSPSPPPPPPPPPPFEHNSRSRSSLKRSNASSPTPIALHSQYYDTSHPLAQSASHSAPSSSELQKQHLVEARGNVVQITTTQTNGKSSRDHGPHLVASSSQIYGRAHPQQQQQIPINGHPGQAQCPITAPYSSPAHQHLLDQTVNTPISYAPPPPAPPPHTSQGKDVNSVKVGSPPKISHQRQASAATLEQLAQVKLKAVNDPSQPNIGLEDALTPGINVKLRPTPGKFGNIYVEEETTLPLPPPPDDFDELPPPPPPPELLLAHDVSSLSLASVHSASPPQHSAHLQHAPLHHHPHHQSAPSQPPPLPHLAGEAHSSQLHQHPAPPCPQHHHLQAPSSQAGTNKQSIVVSGVVTSVETNFSSLERLIAESVANMDFEIPDDIDLTQCPGLVEINKHTPNWKKDMIEKKNQEKIEEYVKNILRQREQEAKWKNVPEWKRKILQKKEEEEQLAKTTTPEKEKKPAEQKSSDKPEKKPGKKAPVPAPPPKDDFVPPKPKGDIVPAALSIDPEELAAMPPWKRELLFKRDKVPVTFSNEFNPDEQQEGENSESS